MTGRVWTAAVFEGRGRERLATLEQIAWPLFAAAAAVAAVLILWMGRGRSFSSDELVWFMQTPDLDLSGALEPHNGHLILVTRLVYKALFETVGVDYLPFTLLTVAMVVLTGGLFFAYVGRRVGRLVALAPTLILLVFGSDSAQVLSGNGFTVIGAVACGLGALLALDRGDRKGDIAACALLCLGVVTYTVALAFVVGVAVSVLLRKDRWQRLWIVAIPIVLYGAWWLWALGSPYSSEQQIALDDVLLFPAWAFQSLSADLGALAGLDYAFSDTTNDVGPALALLAIIALGWRLWRGSVPTMLWAALAIVLASWLMGTISSALFRLPDSPRYLYTGAVVVLVLAAWAAAGARWKRPAVIVLFLVAAAGVATNVALLRDWGSIHRGEAMLERVELAAIEIADGEADPAYAPVGAPTPIKYAFTGDHVAGAYLAATERYGSIGYSVEELRGLSEALRAEADKTLVGALALGTSPTQSDLPHRDCVELGTGPGQVTSFELVAGQAVVLESDEAAAVQVRRFAGLSAVDLGRLVPGEAATLTVPDDEIPDPWQVTAGAPVRACAAPSSQPDLPPGWRRSSLPGAPTAAGILACLEVSTAEATTSSFYYTGPESSSAVSEVILWPSSSTAQEALRAFSGPDAARCNPVESFLEGVGAETSVELKEVQAPLTAGPAVAFRQIIEPAAGTGAATNSTIIFFTRGKAGVLVTASVVGERPFPSKVLSGLLANAERQVKAAVAKSR